MIVYVDGRFVPAEQATVSVFDRGFLYGDGLFETIRVYAGRPFLWEAHLDRLFRGADALRLRLPWDRVALADLAGELLRRNDLADAVLRLAVSRGTGQRGYSIRGADRPTLVLGATAAEPLRDAPPRPWTLRTSSFRLPAGDPLGSHKTSSKLLHVMARARAEADGADEALLLDTAGRIAEAAAANVFWWRDGRCYTPDLAAGGLAGVTRAFVLDLIRRRGGDCHETLAERGALESVEGMFLTLGTLGIVEVSALDAHPVPSEPRTARLQAAYREEVRAFLRSAPA